MGFDARVIRDRTGFEVYLFERLTSTNDVAKKLAASGKSALVIAEEQTKGRGRFHRGWYSPKGGLWFSMLLFPDFAWRVKIYSITLISALAVSKGIERTTGLETFIRWPNDILVNEKKVAGILCEGRGGGLVVGIGINANGADLPDFLTEATTLNLEIGRPVELQELLLNVVKDFQGYYKQFKNRGLIPMLDDLRKRFLLLQKKVLIDLGQKKLTGTALDLDEEGRLVVRSESGCLLLLQAGRVKGVRWF